MRTKLLTIGVGVALLVILSDIASSDEDVRAAAEIDVAPLVTVGPRLRTVVNMVYDCDTAGLGGPCDMRGSGIGQVRYRQNDAGDLSVQIVVNFGRPNVLYQVFFTCGPSHDLGCGFMAIGTLATDSNGAGTADLSIPVGALQTSGPGSRTDHIDLALEVADLSAGVLVAGAINYYVPPGGNSAAAAFQPGDPTHPN